MIVKCYVANLNEKNAPGHNLVFKTIRVGFPTFPIEVTYAGDPANEHLLCDFARECIVKRTEYIYHAQWVANEVKQEQKRFVLCDTDVVWFDNVEPHLDMVELPWSIAGEYWPAFRSEHARRIHLDRLHTAVMVIDPVKLCFQTENDGQWPKDQHLGIEPLRYYIEPRIFWLNRVQYFMDTTGPWWHIRGGTRFNENVLNCFEHLGSATFPSIDPYCAPFLEEYAAIYAEPERARGLRQRILKLYASPQCRV